MDGNGTRDLISFILQSPHSKTISSLSATFCALWRIDRFPGSVSPTPKSKKRKQPVKTSCDVAPSIQVSPFLFLFPLRTALHSPQSRRLARTAGPREGRHRVHRRERHHAADHAGRRHAQNQKEKHASAGILTSRAHPAPAERAAPRGSAAHFSGGRSGRSEGSEGSEGSDAARVDGGGSEVRSEGGEREAVDGTDRQPAAAAKTAETRTREREKRGNEDGSKGIDGSKGAIQGR
ncbi:uncharacterized protein [Blastocystis hominis]|uniref:Uncharacterized protein n=1 Tax=Blastocystis hominis TaxID=12968 RepID=D8LVV9_BLAHO|nr:uncharacterized protein [Blastocystis hominis]CBK19948.2 unnamed protein product [Blastocystis hominis]|eukprot:XP_012893996.1 uncharacterized protein [Blastocystis hominis]